MRRLGFALAVLLGLALVLGFAAYDAAESLSTPHALRAAVADDYVQSDSCRRCHTEQHETWSRTFHRTMTQEATEGTVLGPFDGRTLTYGGTRASFERDDLGAFVVRFAFPDGTEELAEVERTVGSRRYQQYLARKGDLWFRLPVAYHLTDKTWFHMNGAFLTPDPTLTNGAASNTDYNRHLTRWNDNCVFCHNVFPNPGASGDGHFETEVAELGIACEACHGPGRTHESANANPLRRYVLHQTESPDPTIVNPGRLAQDRANQVCGRCHGQRKTEDIGAILAAGDRFVPGEDLTRYSTPLFHDTEINGERPFAPRFWNDGTPRLTAYEYQGLLQSACESDPEFRCDSCHGMHGASPAGQVRRSHSGDLACLSCHEEYADAGRLSEHTGHEPQSSGSACLDCHMPRIVYGVMEIHRSHRVEVPRVMDGRPDACTGCHVDRSKQWARWALDDRAAPEADGLPESLRALFGGDPIERAVAADSLGRNASRTASPDWDAVRTGALINAMEFETYPAVRRLAFQSLRRLHSEIEIGAYVPLALAPERAVAIGRLRERLPQAVFVDEDVREALFLSATNEEVFIGE